MVQILAEHWGVVVDVRDVDADDGRVAKWRRTVVASQYGQEVLSRQLVVQWF
jgi:hypothetical protein